MGGSFPVTVVTVFRVSQITRCRNQRNKDIMSRHSTFADSLPSLWVCELYFELLHIHGKALAYLATYVGKPNCNWLLMLMSAVWSTQVDKECASIFAMFLNFLFSRARFVVHNQSLLGELPSILLKLGTTHLLTGVLQRLRVAPDLIDSFSR